MVNKNIRFKEHDIKKMPDKQFGLLGIKFIDDQGNEFVWWPKWDDVRLILFLSIFTEWANEGPYKWSEMEAFLKELEDILRNVVAWVDAELPKARERLKSLIDKGEFSEVARILSKSDLQKVTDWYATKSSLGNPTK